MTFSTIVSVDTFEEFIEPISALVDECKIHVGEEGLEVRAVDPANVAMIEATLDAGGFESYESEGDLIGVDLGDIEDVLDFAESGQLLFIEFLERSRKLQLRAGGLEYTASLIDPDSIRQEPDIPTLDNPGEFVLEGKDLGRLVTAADMVSDHITLGYDAGNEELYSNGEGDTNDSRFSLEREDLIDTHCSESVRSLYSMDYMRDVTKPIDASAEVTIELGNEYPVDLEYAIAEGQGSIRNHLAPRIAGDD